MGDSGLNRASLAISALFAVIISAFAADASGEVGVRAGLASSQANLYNTTYGRSEFVTGLTASVYYSLELSERVSVRPHLAYAHRGGIYRDKVVHPDGSSAKIGKLAISADYLEVPLLLRVRTLRAHGCSPVLIAGPSFGAVLSSDYAVDGALPTDWLGGTDFAVVFGAGVDFRLGGAECGAEALYRHPLTAVGEVLERYGVEIGGFSLAVGVAF